MLGHVVIIIKQSLRLTKYHYKIPEKCYSIDGELKHGYLIEIQDVYFA